LSRESFRSLFTWSAGFLTNVSPNLDLNSSFGDFAKNFVSAELNNNPSYSALTPTAQTQVLNQAVTQFSQNIAQTIGTAPSSSTPMSDVAYDYIVATIVSWQSKFSSQFLIVWVIVLFLIFRVLSFIFIIITQLIMVLVYESLLAIGFMRIEGVPQTKETVEY